MLLQGYSNRQGFCIRFLTFEYCSTKQKSRHKHLNVIMHLQSHHRPSSAWQPQREAELATHAISTVSC